VGQYNIKGDAYEWRLDLPPAAVRAMLAYACVDLSSKNGKSQAIGHMLWGPKAWQVEFEGDRFKLTSLNRRDLRQILSPSIGTISATQFGSLVRLEYISTAEQRDVTRKLFAAIFTMLGVGIALAMWASGKALWGMLFSAVFAACYFVAFYWYLPYSIRQEPIAFLDTLFADRCLSK
jgi:hypothetical protein